MEIGMDDNLVGHFLEEGQVVEGIGVEPAVFHIHPLLWKPSFKTLHLSFTKTGEALFREGEELKIYFRSEEDCYLLLWYQDVVGNRYIIYPETETQRKTLHTF